MARTSLADLTGEPTFLVGWRKGKRLLAGKVPVHEDVFDDLRGVCEKAQSLIARYDKRVYEPEAQLEKGEQYFVIPTSDLPSPPSGRHAHPQLSKEAQSDGEEPEDELEAVSDIVALVGSSELEEIPATSLKDGSFSFYALVWPQENGVAAFIKKTSPTALIRPGYVYLKWGNTLKKIESPDLVLHSTVDVIITPDRVYALDQTAFQQLFADVKITLQDVPQKVRALAAVLPEDSPLSAAAMATLVTHCGTRPSHAARLRRLAPRLAELELSGEKIRAVLEKHGVDPATFLNEKNEFDFAASDVGKFLDMLDGRWFADDLSGEPRRADRFSRRT